MSTTMSGGPCRCRRTVQRAGKPWLAPGGQPILIATFANGELVSVQRVHRLARDRCPLPAEDLNIREWLR